MLKPFAVAAALALAGSAEAHDYGADIICRVMETDGQRSAWSFAPNTIGAEGSPVSTFVETSYLGHGKSVVSQAGSRPVWLMTTNPVGGVTLLPRNTPAGRSSFLTSRAPGRPSRADPRRCSITAF
jgi:hypothetical protein